MRTWFLLDQLTQDPQTRELLQRAMAIPLLFDSWMIQALRRPITVRARQELDDWMREQVVTALSEHAVYPQYPMSDMFVETLMDTVVTTLARYRADRHARSRVQLQDARYAIQAVTAFMQEEPGGWTAVARATNLVWVEEDLSALQYYRRMTREDFLSGRYHRPWGSTMLSDQMRVYRSAGLVRELFTGQGDMLELTSRGDDFLQQVSGLLSQAGVGNWRVQQQRWTVFRQLDYDRVFRRLFPDIDAVTKSFLDELPWVPGARVLDLGSGTGRVTVDLGVAERVTPSGVVYAVDPSEAMLQVLRQKCRQAGLHQVRPLGGRGESIPLPDREVDVALAVMSIHFMDPAQALNEMVRVTKPGGYVAVLSPHPEFDIREIPMMALWMRPLGDLAERFGLPFGERNGLRQGQLAHLFQSHSGLEQVQYRRLPLVASVEDHQEAFLFYVKGAAFFQHILARLPVVERQQFLKRLEDLGDEIAQHTSREEKRQWYAAESCIARVSG